MFIMAVLFIFTYYQTGIATHYGCGWNGRIGASGIIVNCHDPICAHKTLSFGTIVKVTNIDKRSKNYNKYVYCMVFDRGPYGKNRVLDMMPYQLWDLAGKEVGGLRVKIEVYSSKKIHTCNTYKCLSKKLGKKRIKMKDLENYLE